MYFLSRISVLPNLKIVSFLKRLDRRSFLALAGIAGPLVLIVAEIVAAASADEFNAVSNSMSSLALTPMGYVQTIGFLTIGLLIEVYAAGLLFGVRAARGFHLGIGCLALMGFGLLLIGAFHADPAGAPDTTAGSIHASAASLVFWFFPVVSLLMSHSFRRDPNWRNIFIYSVVTGVLGLILTIVVMVVLEESSSFFGLAERILVVNMIVWVEVTGIKLFRLSLATA